MAETPKSPRRRPRGGYIGEAWLVILLAILYGGALAAVQTSLSGRIEQNKRDQTYDAIPQLVPGADKAKTQQRLVTGEDGKESLVYEAIGADGALKGWVIPASGQGFSDRIDLVIGVNASVSQITGLYVLEQKETPGLGDYIRSESFRDRFRGKPTDRPLVVVKSEPADPHEVRAISGATISSESVAAIVNQAIGNLKGPIGRLAAGGGAAAATE